MLQDILAELHDHREDFLAAVSLCALFVSFLTALLSSLIQMRIARLNAFATTLISDRIRWIERLQSDLATLMTLVERTEFLKKSLDAVYLKFPSPTEAQRAEFNRMFLEYEEKTFQRNILTNLVGIKLDISLEKRNKLVSALNKIAHQTTGITTESDTISPLLLEFQILVRGIIDEEWFQIERQLKGKRRKTLELSN